MIRNAVLKTAGPISRESLEAVSKRFETLLGEPVHFVVEEDPSLIGGFCAYIVGTVYDASVFSGLSAEMCIRDRLWIWAGS